MPGGVLLTKGATTAAHVWSYPNIHGDITCVANSTGVKQGAAFTYDPFGQPMNAAGAVAKDGVPDNAAGKFDYGWLGQHQRGYEHEGSIATIEMGARQYVGQLGRFLQVDRIEDGSANDYDYAGGDPVNGRDLSGQCNDATVACVLAILTSSEPYPTSTSSRYFRSSDGFTPSSDARSPASHRRK